ncbi:pilus assembly protein PilP [Dechloromonas denitrificans]|uniref:pilus assembly protein PilP n=1 Tax=Dechloromonas denitrificans TaxID=281362 RepID=UPI001CF8D07E|nr:pilus assembly protein PilP [Dechloromonas denitrificans]UCV11913.1 pilus assembly protein PilP [Dechloromonas denitrificans]
MADNTKDLRGNVAKLPEVLPYQPVPYDVESILDPFKPGKIEPESKYKQASGKGGAFQPDFEARELRNSLLEKYPLESLKMIGYMNVNKRPMAVILVDEKIKQVKVGDYIGLDFGMVTQISDKEIELRELIQDSAGDWSERKSSLYLQSTEGSRK